MKYLVYLYLFVLVSITACKSSDDCSGTSCLNGGMCLKNECLCPSGYEGKNCETWLLAPFLGSYLPNYNCMNTDVKVIIEASPNATDKLLVTNLGDYSCNELIRLTATVKGDSIFIPIQKVCKQEALPNGYDFSGKGKRLNDTLWLDFQVYYEGNLDICKVKLIK